ncbi:LCP family protein [Streptomyces sp. RB6PN25]|uniref:LCP family protein n=1 Tax=Streptomyces humicola TaxID=2953240 RepID=A0ABT1Q530_9ACTN|nr:LCP family protein [Streptomyces humicola]MCQ4085034.1 LCP family protein [Streptomyces humicola]
MQGPALGRRTGARPAPRHAPRLAPHSTPRHAAVRRKRRMMRLAGVVSLAVLTTSGLSNAAISSLGEHIARIDAFGGLDHRPPPDPGTTFLLVGTDGRDSITPAEKRLYHLGGWACHCTDTIMLAHLSADRSRLSVVSIPRDTYVRLPNRGPGDGRRPGTGTSTSTSTSTSPGTHPARINAAYAEGGPSLTVRMVEQLTQVHIDHYLEMDFTSFMQTVDALGGVPVCTARPLHDPKSGLVLPAGTTVLGGGRALEYVRSRYVDGTSDFGRMERQQRFMAQVIQRATSSGVLLDPSRLARTVNTALASVRADKQLSSADLLNLAQAMRNFSPSSSEFTTVPVANAHFRVPHVGTTVTWNQKAASKLFDAVRHDHPLAVHHRKRHAPQGIPVDVDPATINVEVMNGTGRPGLALRTAEALHATGFSAWAVSGVPQKAARTVISYDPRWDDSMRSLATALPGSVLHAVKGQGPVMRVTVGSAYRSVRQVRTDDPTPWVDDSTGIAALTGDQVVCS